MSRSARSLGTAAAVALVCLLAPVSASAAAPPSSFFGLQGWNTPSQADFGRMSAAGAGTYRVNFPWSQVEPTRGRRDWSHTDQIMRRASARKMQVMPVLIASPKFAASRNAYPPRGEFHDDYAAFVRDAVGRYGAEGEFWDLNRSLPYRPIKAWQVWNEPNFAPYWNRRPDARSYVRFLKLTHDAIASQDESAKVVLGGLSDTKLNGRPNLVPFLGQVYRAGGARYFDIAAVNLYAGLPKDVLFLIRTIRSRMRRSGDSRTQLWLTEFGWASGGESRNALTLSPNGQATRLRQTYRLLIRARGRYRIGMAAWFSWRDRAPLEGEPNWWAINSGLVGRGGGEKPAFRAFRSVAGR